jgi:EAL and modified HD-GYP domain-containing signal transduction protein
MDRVLLSRQPIYRTDMSPFGYELLYRDSDADRATIRDEDEATAQVVVNTFMEMGLQQMVGDRLAFINVSKHFVLGNFCESLPPERVVLELLEPDHVDPALLKRMDQLRSRGYRFAVGDFTFGEEFTPLLEFASIVKFDVKNSPWHQMEERLSRLDRHPVERAAERVETQAQFHFCKNAGIQYFQGYFFCRPEFVKSTRLPLSRLMTLRLIAKLNNPDLNINELEEAIRQDLSLSYKLLRYVGSAACPTRVEIKSIRHAAAMTGIDRLKIWASLILFSGIEEKLRDVTQTAVIRARMCEKLAEAMHLEQADRFFLVGMFSLLDAMLNLPLDEILGSLHLSPDLVNGILRNEGDFGAVLSCVMAYEKRDWDRVRCGNLKQETIREAYIKAMAWAIRSLNGFSDSIPLQYAKSN